MIFLVQLLMIPTLNGTELTINPTIRVWWWGSCSYQWLFEGYDMQTHISCAWVDTLSRYPFNSMFQWKHALFSKIGFLTIHRFQFFCCIVLVGNPKPDIGAAAGFVGSMFPLQMAWLAHRLSFFQAKKKAEAKLEKLKAKQEKSGKSKEGSKKGPRCVWLDPFET